MQFMNGFTLGQYVPGDSIVHALDPRCKIIGTIAALCGLFMASAPLDFAAWAVLLFAVVRFSSLPLSQVLRCVKPIWLLVVFTVVLNVFWTPGEPILTIGPLEATREGLVAAFCLAMRLFFLVIFAGLLMMTTSPTEFSDGLERLLRPLERVGFPAAEMAMMTTIALRFIPTLLEETERILKAQTSRGADFESGGLLRRMKAFVPVLIPLFVLVFHRAENLATAMEARCYQPGVKRTRLSPLAWSRRDTAALACLVLAIVAIVASSRI